MYSKTVLGIKYACFFFLTNFSKKHFFQFFTVTLLRPLTVHYNLFACEASLVQKMQYVCTATTQQTSQNNGAA
jgi:hypothetical protein